MNYFEYLLVNPYKFSGREMGIFDFIPENVIEFTGTDFNDVIIGTDDDDTLNGLGGNDRIFGRSGNDEINGGEGRNWLFGETGDDYITAGSGDDYLGGASGNDTLIAGSGDDRIYAGQGDDVAFGGSGNDIIFGGAGNDFLNGGGGRDEIDGQGGNDILVSGGGFGDTLTGGAGQDVFVVTNVSGSAQVIVTDFTDGVDMIDLSSFSDCEIEIALEHGVSFQAGFNLTRVQFGDGGQTTSLSLRNFNSENLSADDILNYDGPADNSSNSRLQAFDFTEGLLSQNDSDLRIDGTGGDDLLEGTEDDDLIIGGAGDDQIFGEGGDDTLFGQSGDDLLVGGTGADYLSGGGGDDVLIGGSGDDILVSGTGANQLTGGGGNDIFAFTESNSHGNSVVTVITDFTQGEDLLDLSDFSDCEIAYAIDRGMVFGNFANTVLAFPNGQFLVLEDVERGDFSAADILNFNGSHAG